MANQDVPDGNPTDPPIPAKVDATASWAKRRVGLDLARRAAQMVGIHAEGQEATGAANARAYLESRHVVFEVAR